MYLALIVLPLLGSIASGFFGRKVGITRAQLITCSYVIVTTLLVIVAFLAVGFHFDLLTVSMLIPDQFLENYLVLAEPFDSNNFGGDNSGGSGAFGGDGGGPGPGGDPVGGNHGGNSESDDDDDSEHNHGNGASTSSNHGDLAESTQDLIRRQYDSNHPQSGSSDYMDDYTCKHYGQMTEIPAGQDDAVRCERRHGLGGEGSVDGRHYTIETGGWTCSSCELDICNVCAEDEVSSSGQINGKSPLIEGNRAYVSNPTPQVDASDQGAQEEIQDDEGYDS